MATVPKTQTRQVRKIIRIDEERCTGCGECVPSCAEGAIQIVDGKAKLVKDSYCDGLGACLGTCPEGALVIEEREADAFDEEAVEAHLEQQGVPAAPPAKDHHPAGLGRFFGGGGGCPGSALRQMNTGEKASTASLEPGRSALSHWPIQLHLVPPAAPFLRGADLLLAADCVPFAYANFHEDLLRGRVLLIACPKLDETSPYLPKLVEILRTAGLRSITVAHMEVPCCFGLIQLIERAIAEAGVEIELRRVNIGIDGQPR